jgi:hypothetical protein
MATIPVLELVTHCSSRERPDTEDLLAVYRYSIFTPQIS